LVGAGDDLDCSAESDWAQSEAASSSTTSD
jgi:hypothetical protein